MARELKAVELENDAKPKVNKGSKSRGASKKAYHAMGSTILARNKARRAKRVARREAYWATPAGQSRKFEKMNTPAKLKKLEAWKLARDARRRLARETKALATAEAKKD